jgi:hypothetical protein
MRNDVPRVLRVPGRYRQYWELGRDPLTDSGASMRSQSYRFGLETKLTVGDGRISLGCRILSPLAEGRRWLVLLHPSTRGGNPLHRTAPFEARARNRKTKRISTTSERKPRVSHPGGLPDRNKMESHPRRKGNVSIMTFGFWSQGRRTEVLNNLPRAVRECSWVAPHVPALGRPSTVE